MDFNKFSMASKIEKIMVAEFIPEWVPLAEATSYFSSEKFNILYLIKEKN